MYFTISSDDTSWEFCPCRLTLLPSMPLARYAAGKLLHSAELEAVLLHNRISGTLRALQLAKWQSACLLGSCVDYLPTAMTRERAMTHW